MDLGPNRTFVLRQLGFDRIFQAGFRVYECGDGLFEVRIALTVGAKTLEGGFEISFYFAAPLFKVDLYSLVDQAIHWSPENLTQICECGLLRVIQAKRGSFSRRCVCFFLTWQQNSIMLK